MEGKKRIIVIVMMIATFCNIATKAASLLSYSS